MSDIKEFHVIRFKHTDGCDTGPGYWPVSESKTATAKKIVKDVGVLEKATRSKPQMLRLDEDDARFVEWRMKLGILLKQELSPDPREGPPWYVMFPEGFWLYERSKHICVSGYRSKAKLYKTPQDFAIHLIWLLVGSGNYEDCLCIHCNSTMMPRNGYEGLEIIPSAGIAKGGRNDIKSEAKSEVKSVVESEAKSEVKIETKNESRSAPPKSTSTPNTPTLQPTPSNANAPARAIQPSSQPQPVPSGQKTPNAASGPAPRQAPEQAPKPAPNLAPPHLWRMPTSLLFRLGELVWYQNSSIWRLGIVAAPHEPSGGYQLVPLGHGLIPQSFMFKTDGEMRPFHAFSVPPVVAAELKQGTFDTVPWQSLFQSASTDNGRRDLLLLDGSKMAAIKIDFSYSLFSPLDDGKQKLRFFGGIFLGAERIELGDGLRIRGAGEEIVALGLRKIFVPTESPRQVLFGGPEYRLVPSGDPAISVHRVVPPEQLPAALREEAIWRRKLSQQRPGQPGQPSVWVEISAEAVHSEQTVRGRFYPTPRLMPILNPPLYESTVAQGFVDDSTTYLNNRMDAAGRYVGRKKNRLETLGTSVPHGTTISYDQPVREEGMGSGETIELD